jgi:4-nitrophenyl phosphatase
MDRNYNYRKLATAFTFIQTNAKFIATNTDATLPTERGEIPGAGAMVSSLEGCTQKRPIIIGKPNTYLMKLALERTKSAVKDCVVVGDRPETDIAMARKAGCLGIIVLTGVTNKKRRSEYPFHQRPDLIYPSLFELSKEYEKY